MGSILQFYQLYMLVCLEKAIHIMEKNCMLEEGGNS